MTDPTERTCANCKHVVGVRSHVEDAKTWKCHAEPNVVEKVKDPVTGVPISLLRLPTCYAAKGNSYKVFSLETYREESVQAEQANCCGLDGKWFEPYTPPAYTNPKSTKSGDDLLAELESKLI